MLICVNVKNVSTIIEADLTHVNLRKCKKKTQKTRTQKNNNKKKKKKKPNKQTCIYLSVMVHSNQNIFLTIL